MKEVKGYNKIDRSGWVLIVSAYLVIVVGVYIIKKDATLFVLFPVIIPYYWEFIKWKDALDSNRNYAPIIIAGIDVNREKNEIELHLKNTTGLCYSIKCFSVEVVSHLENETNEYTFNLPVHAINANSEFYLPLRLTASVDDSFEIVTKLTTNIRNKGESHHVYTYRALQTINRWSAYLLDQNHKYYKYDRSIERCM